MKKVFRWSMILVLLVVIGAAAMVVHTIFWAGNGEAVPPMRGTSVLDAVALVERMGLEARIEQVESTFPSGTVLSQWPEPGTRIGNNKIVMLKVSKGGHKIALPDVRGLERDQALQKLESSGFSIGDVLKISDDTKPLGVVLAQSPAAPAMVDKGRKIDLMISNGPSLAEGKVSIPQVLQMQEGVARKLIAESGLRIADINYKVTFHSPSGMVIGLSPKAGTIVDSGSGVTLMVAKEGKPEPSKPETTVAEKKTPISVTMPGMGGSSSSKGLKKVNRTAPAAVNETETKEPGKKIEETKTVNENKASLQETPSKTAKIRYQVPPLTKPLELKIELVDLSGSRVVMDKEVKGGEYISTNASYTQEAVVTVYLGGEFVWQDKYR